MWESTFLAFRDHTEAPTAEPAVFADWASVPESDRPDAIAACRRRINGIGRRLNAVVAELPSHPQVSGPLHGMPCAVKDMIATGVSIPGWGLAHPVTSEMPTRAPVLRQLDAAGADIMVATEMTSLAYEPSGYNAARGRVINPWSVDAVCGGSSSGSAALVAAGGCFVAFGSDTGGSVRIPASCCGVTALKPTYGVIPIEGAMPLAPSLDTIGFIARSAVDIALAWAAVTGETAKVPTQPLKVAILRGSFASSDGAVSKVSDEAASILSRLGAVMIDGEGFPEDADTNALTIMQAEAARSHENLLADERIDVTLRRRLAKARSITDAQLTASLQSRDELRDAFLNQHMRGADIALLPVMPIPTPRVSETDPSSQDFSPSTLYAMSRFTRFVNYFHLPALALPAGVDDRGLPVGVQLIGRPRSDALLLSLGEAFQTLTRWHGRVPRAVGQNLAQAEMTL
jgi:aspartyl-tRNA(Asn)/glutamyl-tRNA(Gln) amidotransferase subunit A